MPDNEIADALKKGLKRNLHNGLWLFLPVLVLYLDYITGFKGIILDPTLKSLNISAWLKVLIWVFRSSIIFILAYLLISKSQSRDQKVFNVVFIFSIFLIINLGGLNFWTYYHFALAIIIWASLLEGLDSKVEITGTHWLFLIILLFDFIGFPLVAKLNNQIQGNPVITLISNRLSFPLWFFFVLGFIEKGVLKTIAVIIAVSFYLYNIVPPAISAYKGQIDFDKDQGAEFKEQIGKSYHNFKESWALTFSSWMNRATGGYYGEVYEGKVEENKYEQLGVYIEGLKAAEPLFYEDEKVVVWGNVKAKTLDEPVNLTVSCYVKDGDKITNGTIKEKDLREGKIIFTLEEEPFDCEFKNLTPGTHTVRVKATFNFETQSYLKTYYMDEERKRAMVREDMDILSQFGITETDPISVSTNGPVKLSIGTKTPPTGLIDNDETWVGASIENLWQGDLEDLDELIILVPYGMEIDRGSCYGSFNPYSLVNCEGDCIYSQTKDCKDNCKILFGSDENGKQLNGYKLDVQEIKEEIERRGEDIRNNKRFRSFRCNVKIDKAKEVLGNTPITVAYFRSTSKYKYSVEKSIGVVIKKLPNTNSNTKTN